MRRSPLALVLGLILVADCATEPPNPPVAVGVSVAPATLGLIVSQTGVLDATVFDSQGRPIPNQDGLISWSSSDPAVASVSNVGFVTALFPGAAQVSASLTAGSRVIVGTAKVTVVRDPVESMRIDGPPVIPLGIRATYTVTGVTKLGKLVPVSPVTWSTGDSSIAMVVEGGILGHAEGTTKVYASVGTTTLARAVFVSPFHSQLAVGYANSEVTVRSLENDDVVYEGSGVWGSIDFTPDGRGLTSRCVFGICTVQLSSGVQTIIVQQDVRSPSWSAAGRMVYTRDADRIEYLGPGDERGSWRAAFSAFNPSVSHDGRRVLYECDISWTYDAPDLCIVDLTDPKPDVLISREAGRAAWAPDRDEFVYVKGYGHGRTIMRQKLGETAHPILVANEDILTITWGTDDWLAFSTGNYVWPSTGNHVWLVRADGNLLMPWWHDTELQVTGLSWR